MYTKYTKQLRCSPMKSVCFGWLFCMKCVGGFSGKFWVRKPNAAGAKPGKEPRICSKKIKVFHFFTLLQVGQNKKGGGDNWKLTSPTTAGFFSWNKNTTNRKTYVTLQRGTYCRVFHRILWIVGIMANRHEKDVHVACTTIYPSSLIWQLTTIHMSASLL